MSDMSLMTIKSPGTKPGIKRAAEILGVKPAAMDRTFGVVPIDPSQGLYAVQVRASALAGSKTEQVDGSYRGPFANPRIEGFGPRQR